MSSQREELKTAGMLPFTRRSDWVTGDVSFADVLGQAWTSLIQIFNSTPSKLLQFYVPQSLYNTTNRVEEAFTRLHYYLYQNKSTSRSPEQ